MGEREEWEKAFGKLEPGDQVRWLRTERGGYGFMNWIPATVVRTTATRVRIRLADGRERSVSRMWLERQPEPVAKGEG